MYRFGGHTPVPFVISTYCTQLSGLLNQPSTSRLPGGTYRHGHFKHGSGVVVVVVIVVVCDLWI